MPGVRTNGVGKMSERWTYVVTAATGHTGSLVAKGLLEAGHTVRVLGRDPDRMNELAERGATPMIGDVRDPAFVEVAFQGADAAYLVSLADRNSHDLRRGFADIGTNYAEAARKTGLKSAIFLSTIGTHDERNRGLILIHTDVERALNTVEGLHVVHLRAPSFFENLFYFLRPMQERGVLSTPIAPDTPLETVSTKDIAAVALRLLLALNFQGKTALELHGEPDLTMRTIAAQISQQLGRPFPIEHADRNADIEAIAAAGMGWDFAALLNDTWDLFSQKGLLRATDPTPETRMPTPITEFIRTELVPVLKAPSL